MSGPLVAERHRRADRRRVAHVDARPRVVRRVADQHHRRRRRTRPARPRPAPAGPARCRAAGAPGSTAIRSTCPIDGSPCRSSRTTPTPDHRRVPTQRRPTRVVRRPVAGRTRSAVPGCRAADHDLGGLGGVLGQVQRTAAERHDAGTRSAVSSASSVRDDPRACEATRRAAHARPPAASTRPPARDGQRPARSAHGPARRCPAGSAGSAPRRRPAPGWPTTSARPRPATCGAAIEVPVSAPYPPPGSADTTSTPGATTSGLSTPSGAGPRLEKSAIRPSRSTAADGQHVRRTGPAGRRSSRRPGRCCRPPPTKKMPAAVERRDRRPQRPPVASLDVRAAPRVGQHLRRPLRPPSRERVAAGRERRQHELQAVQVVGRVAEVAVQVDAADPLRARRHPDAVRARPRCRACGCRARRASSGGGCRPTGRTRSRRRPGSRRGQRRMGAVDAGVGRLPTTMPCPVAPRSRQTRSAPIIVMFHCGLAGRRRAAAQRRRPVPAAGAAAGLTQHPVDVGAAATARPAPPAPPSTSTPLTR